MGFAQFLDKIFIRLDEATKRTDGKKDYCSVAPDVWFGVDISPACQIHDLAYANLEVTTRKQADQKLRDHIILLGRGDLRLKIVAWVYYFGVRIAGSIYALKGGVRK